MGGKRKRRRGKTKEQRKRADLRGDVKACPLAPEDWI